MMVPDSKGRREKSIEDLQSILDELAEETDLDAAVVQEARDIIAAFESA